MALAHIWDGPDTFSAPAVINLLHVLPSGWHIAFSTLISTSATSGVVRNHVLIVIAQQSRQIYVGTRVALAHIWDGTDTFSAPVVIIFNTFCQVDGTLRLSL